MESKARTCSAASSAKPEKPKGGISIKTAKPFLRAGGWWGHLSADEWWKRLLSKRCQKNSNELGQRHESHDTYPFHISGIQWAEALGGDRILHLSPPEARKPWWESLGTSLKAFYIHLYIYSLYIVFWGIPARYTNPPRWEIYEIRRWILGGIALDPRRNLLPACSPQLASATRWISWQDRGVPKMGEGFISWKIRKSNG